MAGIDAILGVVSVGATGGPIAVEALEEELTPSEMQGLRPFMNELMIEIGLASKPGEGKLGEVGPEKGEASPSTATSTPSSSPSSPDSAA